MRRSRSTLNTPSTMPVRIASPSAWRRRSSEVSWSRRRRISSMVAARVPSSAPGARGVGVERSPRPIRAAEAVSAWTGRVSRRLIRKPERVASAATSSESRSSSRDSRAERRGHGAARQRGLDQRRHLARRGAQRADGDVEPGALQAPGARPAGRQDLGAQRQAADRPRIRRAPARGRGWRPAGRPAPPIWRANAGSSARAAAAVASGVLASGRAAPSRRAPPGRRRMRRASPPRSTALPGDRRAAGGDQSSPREDGDAGERAGAPEAVEEGGEAGGVSPLHQALDRGALGEQVGRGPHVARRALHRLLGRRPREVDPREPLLVREPLDQPQRRHGDADHRQQDEAGVEADQEGAEARGGAWGWRD